MCLCTATIAWLTAAFSSGLDAAGGHGDRRRLSDADQVWIDGRTGGSIDLSIAPGSPAPRYYWQERRAHTFYDHTLTMFIQATSFTSTTET